MLAKRSRTARSKRRPPATRAQVPTREAAAAGALALFVAVVPWLHVTRFVDWQAAPKQALLLACAAAMLPLVLAGGFPRFRNPVILAGLGLLAGGAVLSLLFAVDWRVGLLGWYSYRHGALTLACFLVLFIAGARTSEARLRAVVNWGCLLGLVGVGLTVMAQETGASNHFKLTRFNGVPNGCVGTANDLAAYSTLALGFGGVLVQRRRAWAWCGLLTLVLTLISVHSVSRAGVGTLILFAAALAALLAIKDPRAYGRVSFALAGGLVLGLLVTLPTGGFGRLAGRVDAAPSGSDLQESGAIRVETWRAGAAIVAAHPVVGVGPGSIPLVFGRYRPANAGELEKLPHLVFASAHNVVLDFAASSGVAAAVGLLLLAGGTVVPVFTRFRNVEPADLFAATGVAGYAAMSSLNPLSIAGAGTAWLLLGFLAARGNTRSWKRLARPRLALALAASAASLVLATLILAAEWQAGTAARAAEHSDWRTAARHWERASSLLPIERRYAQGEIEALVGAYHSSGDREDLRAAKAEAIALVARFEPSISDLLLLAFILRELDPTDPELPTVLARAAKAEPHSDFWANEIVKLTTEPP